MFKRVHYILTFLSFIISLCIYVLTMAPTTSFWDCGEFIASSYIMGVPHPPGAPLFLILGNVFSNIPILSDIGARVNLLSPIVSAFSILFLYLIIVNLLEKYRGEVKHISDFIIINISAFIASLTFAFTDSHWFNAVESEVYSISTFFTAIVLWLILKWADNSDKVWNARYLLLITYMIGLATGVHLLNLLALPFIALIIYFKKYTFSLYGLIITMVLTALSFAIIYFGFILGLPDIVSQLNSINILFLFIVFIVLSIILLHLYNRNNFIKEISKFFSVVTISLIIFFVYNKLFIHSKNKNLMQKYLDKESEINAQGKYFDQIINLYIQNELLEKNIFIDILKDRLSKPDNYQNNQFPIEAFIDNNYGKTTKSECDLIMSGSIWYGDYKTDLANCGNGILDWQESLNLNKKELHKKKDLIPQLHTIKIASNYNIQNLKYFLRIIDIENYEEDFDLFYNNHNITNRACEQTKPEVFPENIVISDNLSNNELHVILKTFFTDNSSRIKFNSLSHLIEKFNQHPKSKEIGLEISSEAKKISFVKLLFYQSSSSLIGLFIIMLSLCFISYYFFWYKENTSIYPLKLFFSCTLLILIGYSTYGTIFIRATQNPRINENTPDNLDRALAYINRDQYGAVESFNPTSAIRNSNSGHWKRWTRNKENPSFSEKMNFIWNYQIKEMYLRYFAWQFIGRADKNENPWLIKDLDNQLVGNRKLDGINFFRYGFPLAFIFGLIGMVFHFTRDWQRALAVLSVFLSTGILIILYLNQYDPQPRERDYSYVGSFFTFSIWIGFGIAFVQEKIKDFFEDSNISSFISITVSIFIFLLMPITMIGADYNEHDRKGNYVAWDYGYNLLNSCAPNAIIFTNGDNDTFPLWYLQEVEKIRTDVRVVNLSLLNTPWYIKQLVNDEPKLNLNFCNRALLDDIYNIEKEYLISTYEGYNLCSHSNMEFQNGEIDCKLSLGADLGNLEFKVPLYRKQYLRVQDYMILQIISDELMNRPIYFAATVSENNQVGLKPYLLMEGMAYKIMTKPTVGINYSMMEKNLILDNKNDTIRTSEDYVNALSKNRGIYRFTNLNNSDIYFNSNIKRLVQNYRIGYIRMAQHQLSLNNNHKAASIIETMNNNFPKEELPLDPWIGFELLEKIYAPLNLIDQQVDMLDYLVSNDTDINIQLISIIKSLELNHYDKVEEYINKYVIENDISHENKIALFYELMSRGYHASFNHFINDISQEILDIDQNNTTKSNNQNSLYAFLGSLIKVKNSDKNIFLSDIIIAITQELLINNYSNNLTVDSQKDLGDILAKYMNGSEFIDYCNITFGSHKIEGLLYSLVNLYMLNDYNEDALMEIDKWLVNNKNNKRMINKRNKIIEKLNLQ